MRLIDADALKRDMKEYLDKIPCENVPPRSAIVHCMVLTDEQPTAYDVDKVVEELTDNAIEQGIDYEMDISLNDAIEIVKRGGVE